MANRKTIIIVSLSVLAIGGVAAYLYFQNKKKKSEEGTNDSSNGGNTSTNTETTTSGTNTNTSPKAQPPQKSWRENMTRFSIGEPVTFVKSLNGVKVYKIYNGNYVQTNTTRNIGLGEDWEVRGKAFHSSLPTWVVAPKGTTNTFVYTADRDNLIIHK
jgi:hypothetical protein